MKNVENIVNEWDPIGLFPLAPQNEYESEIEKIKAYLLKHERLDVNKLANYIALVFIESFGKDIFSQNIEECQKIANKILKSISK